MTDHSDKLLRTIDLIKKFPEFTLGPVNLELKTGKTIAILGKNGAGKTTLFQLMTGHLDPTSGQVLLGNQRITPESTMLRRRLGYLPQNPQLPRWVTGHDILKYAATLMSVPDLNARVKESEEYWDCASFKDRPLATMSYGMQKRVGLALANLNEPEVLILDEPHSGLDIFHTKALDQAILARAKKGFTTVISTHVAAFAADICDSVLAINKGLLSQLSGWEESNFVGRIALIENHFFNPGANG